MDASFRPTTEADSLLAELGRHLETVEELRVHRGRADAEQRAMVALADLQAQLARSIARDPNASPEALPCALGAALLHLLALSAPISEVVQGEVAWQAASLRRLLQLEAQQARR